MTTDKVFTNLERVRTWKSRIFALGLTREQVANQFNRSIVTVSRWTNPDHFGLPPAYIIDAVDAWLFKLEVAAKKKAKRQADRAIIQNPTILQGGKIGK